MTFFQSCVKSRFHDFWRIFFETKIFEIFSLHHMSWRHHLEKNRKKKIEWKNVFLKFWKIHSESIPHVPSDTFFENVSHWLSKKIEGCLKIHRKSTWKSKNRSETWKTSLEWYFLRKQKNPDFSAISSFLGQLFCWKSQNSFKRGIFNNKTSDTSHQKKSALTAVI